MTAETAMVLPILAVFTVTMVWLVSLGIVQVRTIDAARETARAAARSESSSAALQVGRQVAPAGSRIQVNRAAGQVRVRVIAPVHGPAGLFRHLPVKHLQAEAVAVLEPSS